MKLPAIFITSILLLASTETSYASVRNDLDIDSSGESSSVNVRINNNVNTGNGSKSFSSKTKTNVEIHQEGEGTSQVIINGKEYKVEGPGDLSVNEGSNSSSISSPSPTQNPTPTETLTPTPTESPSPTNFPEDGEVSSLTLAQIIKMNIENIKKSFEEFFARIFGGN